MTELPTSAQLLTTLLATESFLLAVVGLAVSLSTPVKGGTRNLIGSPNILAWLASGLLTLIAAGAGLAWYDIYIDRCGPLPFPQPVIAGLLIVVIVLQPVFALMVASGTRFEE